MNTINNSNGGKGKVFTRVVFFMSQNPDNKRWEALAYFPDIPWDSDGRNMTSYMHNGQHGPCAEIYVFENCKVPSGKCALAAVRRLKEELENLDEPYALTVVDTKEWLAENRERAADLKDAVFQLCYKKDSDAMLTANAARRKTA